LPVTVEEYQCPLFFFSGSLDIEQPQCDLIDEQRRCSAIAVVQLVTAQECFGHQLTQIDTAEGAYGFVEQGTEAVAKPAQPIQDTLIVGPGHERFTQSLH
jgi:hypothetical protein